MHKHRTEKKSRLCFYRVPTITVINSSRCALVPRLVFKMNFSVIGCKITIKSSRYSIFNRGYQQDSIITPPSHIPLYLSPPPLHMYPLGWCGGLYVSLLSLEPPCPCYYLNPNISISISPLSIFISISPRHFKTKKYSLGVLALCFCSFLSICWLPIFMSEAFIS